MGNEEDEPHYLGHRKRLREKFRESGTDAFHDYELLELVLTYAIPRGDVKPIAKRLLEKFDSLSGVLEADREELIDVDGVGEVSATFFPLLKEINQEYLAEKMKEREVLDGPEAVADFARLKIGGKETEAFMAIYVDKQNQVRDYEILQEGTVDHTTIHPREVLKSALENNAQGIIVIHNHPSGTLKSSGADDRLTQKLQEATNSVDIELLDHLIVSESGYERVPS